MRYRTREQLRADFAETGEPDYLAWLARQPEGDPGGREQVVIREFPTKAEQAKNFVTAAAQHAFHGFKKCSEDDYQQRWSVCCACEFLHEERCRRCGCFMRLKAYWAEQRCPEKKW